MSKMIRLDEDVYFALKARASKDRKTLSATVYALMHTANEHTYVKKRLNSLESQIKDLKRSLFSKEATRCDEKRKSKAEGEIRTRVVASTGRLFEYKPHNSLISVDSLERARNLASSPYSGNMRTSSAHSHYSLATLELHYNKNELTSYTKFRKAGLSERSKPWMNKASQTFWNATQGKISKASIEPLRNYVLARYTDIYAKRKALNFAKAFLSISQRHGLTRDTSSLTCF
jgi:hypothetical protein